jgi:hypothetical protein
VAGTAASSLARDYRIDLIGYLVKPSLPILHDDRMINECFEVSEMITDSGKRSTRRKPASMPHCPPQIPDDLTLE